MTIYVVTENHYLFTGIMCSLSVRVSHQFVQLDPRNDSNYSVYRAGQCDDIFIVSLDYSKIKFSLFFELNSTDSSVIISSNYFGWNVNGIFRFSTIPRVFYLSELLQAIHMVRPIEEKSIRLPRLTKQERTVLALTMSGLTVQFISSKLNITDKAAYTHQRNIFKKIGIRKRQDLLRLPDDFLKIVCDKGRKHLAPGV